MIYTIYKISIAGEDYIGSTKDLKQRKADHKKTCNNENLHNSNYKLYQHIRANGGWDCCEITPIEEFDCETKQQALIREEYWRREYRSFLNMRKSSETEEERKERNKEYYIKKCEKVKNEFTTNCECGGVHKPSTIKRHLKTERHQKFINHERQEL